MLLYTCLNFSILYGDGTQGRSQMQKMRVLDKNPFDLNFVKEGSKVRDLARYIGHSSRFSTNSRHRHTLTMGIYRKAFDLIEILSIRQKILLATSINLGLCHCEVRLRKGYFKPLSAHA
jgi:hypothetical protein